jgi:CRP/FNR family cyclic AMP-dependent transcriptional regulator
LDLNDKRIFLIATMDDQRRAVYSKWVSSHIAGAKIYTALDGSEAYFKIENDKPHVLITDLELAKISGIALIEKAIRKHSLDELSVVITTEVPDTEHFVDEVVRGSVQFLVDPNDEIKFDACISRALNRLSGKNKAAEYSLHFLAPEQVLFQEGDDAPSVFFVRRGQLKAYKSKAGDEVFLGDVLPGEFVGEMSHFNNEPRSATVKAVDHCELIEIPRGSLDMVLFTKPAWAQALVRTLAKRLKRTNEELTKERS